MFKNLIAVTLLMSISSCLEQKKENKDTPSRSVVVSIAGASNLGKIPIGESRHTGINIRNDSLEDVFYTLTGVESPLSVSGVSEGCTIGFVPKGKQCLIKMLFTPISTLERLVTVSILSQDFVFRGRGLREGELSISPSTWNAGSFEAGSQQVRTFSLSNIGDTEIAVPGVVNPDFRVSSHSCGDSISPQETCTMAISATKFFVEEITEDVHFYITGNPILTPFSFIGSVRPSTPSGLIEFETGDTLIIADGVSQTEITSRPIRDMFGNVVSDGHFVAGTGQNIELADEGRYTLNGVVSFEVTSTEIVGPSRLYLSSGTASGIYNITSVSGPPVGVITAQSYNPNLRANGYSTITIVTNPLISAIGNIVTDGEIIDAELTGPGIIETPVISTVNGVAMVRIRADFTAGTSQLTLRANPVRDIYGNITEYQAIGTFNINFLPVEAVGNFNISTNNTGVYSGSGDEFNKNVTITVSDIKDIYDNLVGAGVTGNVSIINGFNFVSGLKNFPIETEETSSFSFMVSPELNIRDFIEIEVEISGKYNNIRIFAMPEGVKRHNRGTTNEISLHIGRDSSDFNSSMLPPGSSKWSNVESNHYAIRSQDGSSFSLKKSFGLWRPVSSPQRHMMWDCILPVESYVMISPCEVKKTNGEVYAYSAMAILESVIERTPELYVNANVPGLPNHSSGFNGHAIGVTPIYSKSNNSFYLLGGAIPEEVSVPISGGGTVTRYKFSKTPKDIKYKDVTLLSFTPLVSTGLEEELATPMFSSSYTYKGKTFFFGGLSLKDIPGENENKELLGGDTLQVFEHGQITTLNVTPGVNGAPPKRFQNGVYYDHILNKIYIVSGVNTNDIFLDDLWSADLSSPTPTWNLICNPCGIPDLTSKVALIISNTQLTPITLTQWMTTAENIQPLRVFSDRVTGTVYLSRNNSSVLKEIDLTNGQIQDVTDDNFLDFRNFGQLLYHHDIDRFYKHSIIQPGTTDTRLQHMDGRKGEMAYYMAEITFDELSTSFAKKITPIISAYSENKTYITSNPVTTYGVEALIFNFTINQWESIGYSNASSPNYLTSEVYNITHGLTNTSQYFDSNNKVYLMIKPRSSIGYTEGSSIRRSGENTMIINMIKVEGVF